MIIEETALAHWIENFYGHGSWKARAWFIAHEDGGGDVPEEVAEKINYFYRKHPPGNGHQLCNLRDLYQHMAFNADNAKANMYSNLYDFRFGHLAVANTAWNNLIAFVHGFRGEILPNLLDYQKKLFVDSSSSSEALLRLYPLPSANHHAWYYSWLDLPQLSFLKTREQYEQHVYETRMQTLLDKLRGYHPEVVIMYGMNNINKLKQSILQFFPNTVFKAVKAVKQHTPQHHHAVIGQTTLVITTQLPTLRHHRVETGFDWEAFGKAVRRKL